ncbi:uncharacterized protein LOC144700295 [Wolffia australiana]
MAPPSPRLLKALFLLSAVAFLAAAAAASPSPAPSPFSRARGPVSPFRSPPAPPAFDDDDLSPGGAPGPSPWSDSPSSEPPSSDSALPSDAPAPLPSGSAAQKIDQAADLPSSHSAAAGQKAGVAFGVIAAAALVGIGAVVYKKRRDNVRRTQFGIEMRREML